MIKAVEKKADASALTLIIWVVVGILVAIIVIVGFTRGWDSIFGIFKAAPGNLETVAQSCGLSAQNNLATSYCNEFKEVTIASRKQYANCEYLEGFATFTPLDGGCNLALVDNLAKQLCNNKNLDEEYVNEKTCTEWKAG